MLAARRGECEAPSASRGSVRPFLLRDPGVRFVFEREHGLAVVVIPDPTFERDARAGRIGDERAFSVSVSIAAR